MEEKLKKLRKKIDKLDKKISKLLLKRFSLASEIGNVKKALNKELKDCQREAQILTKIEQNNSKNPYLSKLNALYKQIFRFSLEIEQRPRLALIGANIGKSLSKKVHNLIAKEIGLNYEFMLIEKEKIDKNWVKNELKSGNFKAFFITMPYKKTLLDICDLLTKEAVNTGVINIIYEKDNKLIGANSDTLGFGFDFRKKVSHIKEAYILGSGATAKSVEYALSNLKIASKFVDLEKGKKIISYSELAKIKPELIINTTPLGMNKNDKPLLNKSAFMNCRFFYDVLYYDKITMYQNIANCKSTNGIDMLILQAVFGILEIFNLQLNVSEVFKKVKDDFND